MTSLPEVQLATGYIAWIMIIATEIALVEVVFILTQSKYDCHAVKCFNTAKVPFDVLQ